MATQETVLNWVENHQLCAGRSIPTAISAGAAFAFTSAVIDIGKQTTRVDTGKEYYPYTTKKSPHVN